jgi:hypothetical protein
MYTDIQSAVKWKGTLSMPFTEEQGIRQGGASSADIYKAGKNRLLYQLDQFPSSKIGHIHTGAVMVADDLAVTASDRVDMQASLNIAALDASRERYKFNADKTKTVSVRSTQPPKLNLNGKPLGCSDMEVHVGIARSCKNHNKNTVKDRVQTARRAAYSLMGAGFHGLNGTGPEIATLQYKTYVLPTLLYGLQALVLKDSELEILSSYHRTNLRCIQHLPRSTAIPALYLLLGVLPIKALVHIQTLSLFGNIISASVNNPPALYIKDLVIRQLAVKELESSSWASQIRRLLVKYDLPPASSMLSNPPAKAHWKAVVKAAVHRYWTKQTREAAHDRSTLQYLCVDLCSTEQTHPVWQNLNDPLTIRKATVKALLLVQRYPLASAHTAGPKRSESCPLCSGDLETTTHFLLHCPSLHPIRQRYLKRILETARQHQASVDPENITRIILDSNHLPTAPPCHEALCRNFIFSMHNARAIALGGESAYVMARIKNNRA